MSMDELKFKKVVSHGFIFYESELADAKFPERIRKLRITKNNGKWDLLIKGVDDATYHRHRVLYEYDTKRDLIESINRRIRDGESWLLC